jgi:uncharacterized protein YwqG
MVLPNALEAHRAALEQTRLPFIRIRSHPIRPLPLWASKVGGTPYLPKTTPWPASPDGQPLFFLAQINFGEMPPLPPFPQKGIVQFYIHDDDLYGMDFDEGEKQNGFRVLYFAEVVENEKMLHAPVSPLRPYDILPHHPDECYPLGFERAEEMAPVSDYRFWEKMGQDFFQKQGAAEWEVMDEYQKVVSAQGHKIGGYAYFTQDDPRTTANPMVLLFQLDSDETLDLMWGDMGVGHFFIREQDLAAGDFSKVLYDWDCM